MMTVNGGVAILIPPIVSPQGAPWLAGGLGLLGLQSWVRGKPAGCLDLREWLLWVRGRRGRSGRVPRPLRLSPGTTPADLAPDPRKTP